MTGTNGLVSWHGSSNKAMDNSAWLFHFVCRCKTLQISLIYVVVLVALLVIVPTGDRNGRGC